MAIFRTGGGKSGIANYLVTGEMRGREQHRDEIDQRLILEGDLAVCDRIINSRDTDANRYEHISISFFEGDISDEKLKAITAEFKEFISAAYSPDELYFYAEAHLPKTATERKWSVEKKKFEIVKRRSHVHAVIPKTNVISGKYASPLELMTARYATKITTIDFVDAFQEYINEKYELASPKDAEHKRAGFISKSEIISRIKGDEFKGKNRAALAMIRDKLIEQNIETTDAFTKMLETMGEVSVGNGKDGAYLQIKLPGETRNVRLKDYQFSAEFINSPMAEKFAYYQKKTEKTPEQLAEIAQQRRELLKNWPHRAREIKYLTPSSKIYLEHYVKATDAQKVTFLDRMEAAHYAKLNMDFGYVHENKEVQDRLHKPSNLTPEQLAALNKYLKSSEWKEPKQGIEGYTSAKLNQSYLRTIDELREAEAVGKQIIDDPLAAIDELTFSQSHFTESALERYLLENTADAEQYNAAMQAVLNCAELVTARDADGELLQFTSKNIIAIEKALVEDATAMTAKAVVAVTEVTQAEVKATRPFNEGQSQAFDLLCSGKQLAVVNGAAGTGKSFVLAAMREAYEKEGFNVIGAILQGKTAEDLQRDSGIKSGTIAMLLSNLKKGKVKLDDKTVLVVDEAGMVGSRDMQKLLAYTRAAGARIRLVGDANQLAAVEYGNAFVEVSKRSEVASLTQIMRQKTEWQLTASGKFSRLEIGGLQDYMENDRVHLGDTMQDAQIALVAAWTKHRTEQPEQTRIVLTHTNAARIDLNELMREALKKEGQLTEEIDVHTTRGKIKMAVGEQVMFTKGDKELNVRNGTTGIITGITAGWLAVDVGDGKIINFEASPADSESEKPDGIGIDYAYCVTVHKSQGMTLDKSFVLASDTMTKENLGVAMTRHRYDAEVFASAEQFGTLTDMLKIMDRTGDKAFTANANDWTETARKEDSVIGQYLAKLNADRLIEKAAKSAAFKEIIANLDPQRVLDHVSKSHNIDIKAYEIITTASGQKLIKSEKEVMSAASFLTKKMHLDYKTEAAPILKQCYAEQLEKAYSIPRGHEIDQELAKGFAGHLKARAAQYKAARAEMDTERRTAAEAIETAKEAALSTAETTEAKDNAESIAKAAMAALALSTKIKKAEHKLLHEKPQAEAYKDYLAGHAPRSIRHLNELERVAVSKQDKARHADIQKAMGITPGLDKLTAAEITIGVNNVLNRTNGISTTNGRPPNHILARNSQLGRLPQPEPAEPIQHVVRNQQRATGVEAEAASGVYELPLGGVDAQREIVASVLPNAVPGRVGDGQTGQDNDVRRAGAGAAGGREEGKLTAEVAEITAEAEEIQDLLNLPEPGSAEFEHAERYLEIDIAEPEPEPEPVQEQGGRDLAHYLQMTHDEKRAAEAAALAIENAKNGSEEDLENLIECMEKLDEMHVDAREAAMLFHRVFDQDAAERKASSSAVDAAFVTVNKLAAERGITAAIPYPASGQRLDVGYEYQLKEAEKALAEHQQTPRPTGIFKGKEGAAHDAATADLTKKLAGWKTEIAWRDAEYTKTIQAGRPAAREFVEKLRAADVQAKTLDIERTAPARERVAALDIEKEWLKTQIEKLTPEQQTQIADALERGRDGGMGR